MLTFESESVVTSKEKQGGEYEVFNLEVRGLHNFLVGRDGVVVHNNCMESLFDFYKEMFKNADDVLHILRGKVNSAGLGSGVHHKSAIDAGTAIFDGTKTYSTKGTGVYEVKVKVKDANGNFQPKTNPSTFFSDEWSEIEVMENILHAWESNVKIPGTTNTYKGFSIDSKIEIHMYLRPDGSIQSAFPLL